MNLDESYSGPSDNAGSAKRMPVLFVGHGSPMNAIEDNEFSRAWTQIGKTVPRPNGILCISAHWETSGTRVTDGASPRTIHDFYGFPDALFRVQYPAPGSPALARAAAEGIRSTEVAPDDAWGLDHGAWSILCRMYPEADIPVVQLSLDRWRPPAGHYELGKELAALRERGTLIVGSGNIVHNLREVVWEDKAFEWAVEFDSKIEELILSGDHDAIMRYESLGPSARLAVPTNEHFLPLLYILAMQEEGEGVSFFAEKVTLGSMSMRSLRIG